jgi:hypothetical protein
MNQTILESADVLLAWINNRLEVISEAQHRLARERVVLQEQATRLRLGVPAIEVHAALVARDIARRGAAVDVHDLGSAGQESDAEDGPARTAPDRGRVPVGRRPT